MIGESERLIVRHLVLDDAAFIVNLLNDESFIRYIADKHVRSIADAIKYLKQGPLASYSMFGFGLNMVQLKTSKVPIGICGLLKREELPHPDLGYALLPQYCGKGYAQEAARLVLEDGLINISLETVLAVTLADNHSSKRLLQSVGFEESGVIQLYDCENLLYKFTK